MVFASHTSDPPDARLKGFRLTAICIAPITPNGNCRLTRIGRERGRTMPLADVTEYGQLLFRYIDTSNGEP